MDKNIGGVDLEELMKAREELNEERGIETDPNMYNDYNPNRNAEDDNVSQNQQTPDEETEIAENTEGGDINSDFSLENSIDANEIPEISQTTEESVDNQAGETSSVEKDLNNYDMFAQFEVKQDTDEEQQPELKEESNDSQTSDDEQPESQDLETEVNNILNDDSVVDPKVETVSAEELAQASGIPAEEKLENDNDLQNLLNDILNETEQSLETDDDAKEELLDGAIQINDQQSEQQTDETVNEVTEENIVQQPKEEPTVEQNNPESEAESIIDKLISEKTEYENSVEENVSNDFTNTVEETDENQTTEHQVETQPEVQEDVTEQAETQPEIQENIAEEETIENEISENEVAEENPIENEIQGNVAEENYVEKEVPNVQLEKNNANSETEIITDYAKLKDILLEELNSANAEEEQKLDEIKDGEPESVARKEYKFIPECNFLAEISEENFKKTDKLSYILGKDENGDMIYGNFKEHFNLAVFGKEEICTNNLLDSIFISLSLKNNIDDVNFVILDPDVNSKFETYNQSSYMFFNRIAKTNKEIGDTLIEITKELDDRYDKLAKLEAKNIDQYNSFVSEAQLPKMPYLIVMFNNFTKSSQAPDFDRISTCLYQLLKLGRIAGIYLAIVAKGPILDAEINYNLPSRIAFKSDEDSLYTLGESGVIDLPSDLDVLYSSIANDEIKHLRLANISETEIDLLIKNMEE